ncbi:TraM recognition domain-containing protein [Streptomyces sp. enrichment culture]|uniref:type IV secretory system conjugative DNA transfer family protein n=1 Tax=Streptomyces sp. enrichment culture TaxID=1795815 RepID=UPI003F57506A
MTLLVWTATGLAAWFAHGTWPGTVTFGRTPLAMRHLIAHPHDLPGAWPDTPAAALSGYGLFWGLLIGQLMILVVLTVFVLGTVARWRAVRAGRRRARREKAEEGSYEVPEPRRERQPTLRTPEPHGPRTPEPHTVRAPEPHTVPAPEPHQVAEAPAPQAPAPHRPPAPDSEPALSATAQEPPLSATAQDPAGIAGWTGGWDRVLVADRDTRRATATQAVQDADGPVLLVTSDPTLWQTTKDGRAKLGPTLLYDPTHRCDTPARLHWSPTEGCQTKETAVRRATALLTPVRPTSRLDQAVSDTAETLLRSYLHAAALENRTIRHVHRWSQGTQLQEAVRTLRTHPKAAPGSAGELEATLTAHPERRDVAQELIGRALAALFTVNIREACTPNRSDALALDSFLQEGGTLYVVGESIEDPRTNPGAMPLLTALVASVVERGRRMAERSSSGRLDPPLTLVLDDIAAVAPLPQLPDLLTTGADRGLRTLALLRSREQARSRWPHDELPV